MIDISNIQLGDEGIILVPKDAPATYNLLRMWEGERVIATALSDHQGRPFTFHDPITDTYLNAVQVELLGIVTFNIPPECLTLVKTPLSDATRLIQLQAAIDEAFGILSDADNREAQTQAWQILRRYADPAAATPASDPDADWTAHEENDLIGDDTPDYVQYNPLGI